MNEDRIIVQTCAEFGLNVYRSIIVRPGEVKLDLIITEVNDAGVLRLPMIQIYVFILDSRGRGLDFKQENHTSDNFVNVYVVGSTRRVKWGDKLPKTSPHKVVSK